MCCTCSCRYEDVNRRSEPSHAKRKPKQSRVHFSQPAPAPMANGYYYPGYPQFMPYPAYYPQPGQDPYQQEKKESKYKVHTDVLFRLLVDVLTTYLLDRLKWLLV